LHVKHKKHDDEIEYRRSRMLCNVEQNFQDESRVGRIGNETEDKNEKSVINNEEIKKNKENNFRRTIS
jgi:hypothetical protein